MVAVYCSYLIRYLHFCKQLCHRSAFMFLDTFSCAWWNACPAIILIFSLHLVWASWIWMNGTVSRISDKIWVLNNSIHISYSFLKVPCVILVIFPQWHCIGEHHHLAFNTHHVSTVLNSRGFCFCSNAIMPTSCHSWYYMSSHFVFLYTSLTILRSV